MRKAARIRPWATRRAAGDATFTRHGAAEGHRWIPIEGLYAGALFGVLAVDVFTTTRMPMTRPSACAVLRLTVNSNLVGCSTGMSPGGVPRKILPTISAVLGHASPESTDLYLSVDRDRLLECVLDVPNGSRS